ncbi:hypothetical protein MKW94_013865 [Papaver nudicaule]|uniref:Bidirectional sugar transporter SWEET n=1 Tax=Papaver nudicaule TaxID=74823 RepID=A0AA42AXS1_PAPNU|nr:hypothetical protein [Papaver nudicaule]
MDNLSFFAGVLGNLTAVLVFLSPIETFCRIVRNRSTGEFESLPYICTLLNVLLWTYYGVTKPGAYLVASVNAFGIVVESVYIILFLAYARPEVKVISCSSIRYTLWHICFRSNSLHGLPYIQYKTARLVVGLDIIAFAAAVLITHFALDGDVRIDAIGFLGAGWNIVMYASPLAAMRTVVRTNSVEYMPFFLSLFLFLNAGIWSFYAVLVKDPFLGVPNAIGFILGIVQLAIYARYRNSTNSSSSVDSLLSSPVDSLLEEGSPRDPLLLPSPLPPIF